MKILSANLNNSIKDDILNLAIFIKLTLTNGEVKGFTSLDANLDFENITYLASNGFTPAQILNKTDVNLSNFFALIDNDEIKREDLLSGKYNNAEIEIFALNYNSVLDGKIPLLYGFLGNIEIDDGENKGGFKGEISGLSKKLDRVYGQIYTPNCRANFGDNKCKIDINNHKLIASVTSVVSNQEFFINNTNFLADEFNWGFVEFVSGSNSGKKIEIKKSLLGGKIELMLPLPFPLNSGDNLILYKGCDKGMETCSSKYNNIINFRGEPYVPGIDKIVA